jgi:hypothetical protein
MVTHKEMVETREKFFKLAKESFPNTGEPGTVWVLSEVLGWEWDKIKNVAVEGFSKESYRIFILDDMGKRIPSGTNPLTVKTVTRKWTNEEKRKLRDWWWLLGY